jgi:hypothetical protein
MKVHVLMNGLEFVGHRRVQKMNALRLFHTLLSEFIIAPIAGHSASTL